MSGRHVKTGKVTSSCRLSHVRWPYPPPQRESHLPPGKGDYVAVSDEELAALEIESSHTIDIESFVGPFTDASG